MRYALPLLLAFAATAQPAPQRFEVASVKPVPPPPLMTFQDITQGRLPAMRTRRTIDKAQATYLNYSLLSLIREAFGLESYQVSAPAWTGTALFDIQAKIPEGASEKAVPEMLRELLRDRFALKVRLESKEYDVMALTVARGGIKLKAVAPEDDAAAEEARKNYSLGRNSSAPADMNSIALVLKLGDKPVLNETGLKGQYMAEMSELMRSSVSARLSGAAGSDLDTPGVSTVLRDWGLELKPRKLTAPHLVVESVEKTPIEN